MYNWIVYLAEDNGGSHLLPFGTCKNPHMYGTNAGVIFAPSLWQLNVVVSDGSCYIRCTVGVSQAKWSFPLFCRMAVDIYDSQYLLILAPTLVIALMFLFFWLFMKETSYDEVLARQKRDLKLPPAKTDSRKKNEKKKNKKKEITSGGNGGGGGESEEDLLEFDLVEGVGLSLEAEEEPVLEITPEPAPPVLAASAPVSASPEAPTGLRERKKKEKKAAKAAAAAAASAAVSISEELEINDSKPASHKTEPPKAVSKQSSPPSSQFEVPAVQTPAQVQAPPQTSGKKEKKKKQKAESGMYT